MPDDAIHATLDFAQALALATQGGVTTTEHHNGHTITRYDTGFTVHTDGASRPFAVEYPGFVWHRKQPGR